MDAISSMNASATPAAQAVQAGQAGTATGTSQTQAANSGLPPVGLAGAASANTLNAEVVSSLMGVDPASVSGVYGGAAASDSSGGIFSGTMLLPLLTNLTHANAEQALAILGVQTPTPGSDGTAGSSTAAASSAATSQYQAAMDQAPAASSGPTVVDPLWGKSA